MGTGNRTGTVTDRPTPRCRAETTLPPPLLLLLGLGLLLLHCVLADGNSTRSPATHDLLCGGPAENCSATTTQPKRKGHFSRCPKQYKHYCIKGRCRFVVAEQTPSCVCDEGYTGARCERVDLFYLRGGRGQILVICLIAVMVFFIILVISVCTCCQPRLISNMLFSKSSSETS
ncbi:probetacellulin isoform X2 [Cavia porcellus]|uniref:probetacellulin isoform X2 n=1 Tax=Cavia porcellus TaxID=10141 RepID=UPI000661B1D6|nr:probetacellulin isoform X2 [Cavia porcellus]